MATGRKATMATRRSSRSAERPAGAARQRNRQPTTPANGAPALDEEELLYRVLAIFDPDKLIVANRPNPVEEEAGTPTQPPAPVSKCGTPELASVVEDVVRHYEALSPRARSVVDRYLRVHKQDDTYTVEYPEASE